MYYWVLSIIVESGSSITLLPQVIELRFRISAYLSIQKKISFLAYISVRYELVDNGPGSIPSVILIGKDDPPGLLQYIWRLAKLFPESETSPQVERQTVNRVMRWCERRGLSIEEKVQKLKSLICQNNIFAINKLKEISPDDYEQSDEIKLCEAMLSPQKYGNRRGWNVPMMQHLFEPCHRFRGIRTHKVEWLLGRFSE